ncbi:MAG: Uma2 family endonuclease [Acidobacteriia bacterium]|nr:Uma2 family endonuclease [Terriglobia bacterium]
MKSAALISVAEYLRTAYSPDCDYVDGEVQERNLGARDHSTLQGEFLYYFRSRKKEWKVLVYPEQRVQVSPTRFRIPDVCVYVGEGPKDQIFRTPPFICIEVLSPEDRTTKFQQRIDDYLKFGVQYIWVIDPATRRAWVHTKEGVHEAKNGILQTENPTLTVPLSEIFAALDE